MYIGEAVKTTRGAAKKGASKLRLGAGQPGSKTGHVSKSIYLKRASIQVVLPPVSATRQDGKRIPRRPHTEIHTNAQPSPFPTPRSASRSQSSTSFQLPSKTGHSPLTTPRTSRSPPNAYPTPSRSIPLTRRPSPQPLARSPFSTFSACMRSCRRPQVKPLARNPPQRHQVPARRTQKPRSSSPLATRLCSRRTTRPRSRSTLRR
jgi:hypothetical protein